ncbi:hypothetical protein [Rufibacter roseolus]|uniref:hypothetical protein n=1 Tax=Rufibacter roseolus TaxID=2817375 RepID=UPI001B30111C|nr:hypothetical protein [Rufibacter roseolus]
MNQLKLFGFLLITIAVQSCCQKLYFKKDELSWVKPYDVDDIFVFKSDKNNIDSLRIVRKDCTKPKDSRECNWFVSYYLSESVRIDYQVYHDGKWSNTMNLLNLEKRPKGETNELILRVFQLEYFNKKTIKEETYLSSINKQVSDSYVFTKDRAYVLDSRIGITKFYWSESLGLVKYISEQGETWELQTLQKNNNG